MTAPRPTRHRGRAVACVLAWLGVAVSVLGVFLHHSGLTAAPVMIGATFASWAWLCCLPALLLALPGRAWVAALASLALFGTGIAGYGRLFVANDDLDGGPSRPFVVAVQNLEFGEADPAAVVRMARESGADVLLTVEMTPASATALDDAGLRELYPHRELDPRPGAAGVGIWSRHPLSGPVRHEGFELGVLSAEAATPSGPVTLVSAHPISPIGPSGAPRRSADEADRARGVLAAFPRERPVVVGGDFNATWDHARFRDLDELGYVDSVDGGGDGLIPTWPVGTGIPPLIGIDHVLARGARSIGDSVAHDTAGTDHRGLVATVRLDARPPG